ncbi:uncharacterized protein LOC132197993 isoform X2 [Neocloeon triangulifer]|uniref:uncharacterized protein LOC132197993 isoform X2 n=1 Tax=Neocloeon triangulifer TaxID=2078957 RepID=UPI00286F51E9|nr:uncharacterized protein LOC132197993 isoform X2 [Neocloeon triangulifer]
MPKTSSWHGPSYRYHSEVPVTDKLYHHAFAQFQQYKFLTLKKMKITIGSFVELQDVERLQVPGSEDNLPPPKFAQIFRILKTEKGPYLLIFWFHPMCEEFKRLPIAPPKDRIFRFPDFSSKDVILDRRSPVIYGAVTYHQIAAVRSFVKVHFRDDPMEILEESGMEFIQRFDVVYKNDKTILIPRLKQTDLKNDVYPVDAAKINETLKEKCETDSVPPSTIDSKSASVTGQKSSDRLTNKDNLAPSTSNNTRTPVLIEDEDNLETRLQKNVIQTRSYHKHQREMKKHAEKPSISNDSKEDDAKSLKLLSKSRAQTKSVAQSQKSSVSKSKMNQPAVNNKPSRAPDSDESSEDDEIFVKEFKVNKNASAATSETIDHKDKSEKTQFFPKKASKDFDLSSEKDDEEENPKNVSSVQKKSTLERNPKKKPATQKGNSESEHEGNTAFDHPAFWPKKSKKKKLYDPRKLTSHSDSICKDEGETRKDMVVENSTFISIRSQKNNTENLHEPMSRGITTKDKTRATSVLLSNVPAESEEDEDTQPFAQSRSKLLKVKEAAILYMQTKSQDDGLFEFSQDAQIAEKKENKSLINISTKILTSGSESDDESDSNLPENRVPMKVATPVREQSKHLSSRSSTQSPRANKNSPNAKKPKPSLDQEEGTKILNPVAKATKRRSSNPFSSSDSEGFVKESNIQKFASKKVKRPKLEIRRNVFTMSDSDSDGPSNRLEAQSPSRSARKISLRLDKKETPSKLNQRKQSTLLVNNAKKVHVNEDASSTNRRKVMLEGVVKSLLQMEDNLMVHRQPTDDKEAENRISEVESNHGTTEEEDIAIEEVFSDVSQTLPPKRVKKESASSTSSDKVVVPTIRPPGAPIGSKCRVIKPGNSVPSPATSEEYATPFGSPQEVESQQEESQGPSLLQTTFQSMNQTLFRKMRELHGCESPVKSKPSEKSSNNSLDLSTQLAEALFDYKEQHYKFQERKTVRDKKLDQAEEMEFSEEEEAEAENEHSKESEKHSNSISSPRKNSWPADCSSKVTTRSASQASATDNEFHIDYYMKKVDAEFERIDCQCMDSLFNEVARDGSDDESPDVSISAKEIPMDFCDQPSEFTPAQDRVSRKLSVLFDAIDDSDQTASEVEDSDEETGETKVVPAILCTKSKEMSENAPVVPSSPIVSGKKSRKEKHVPKVIDEIRINGRKLTRPLVASPAKDGSLRMKIRSPDKGVKVFSSPEKSSRMASTASPKKVGKDIQSEDTPGKRGRGRPRNSAVATTSKSADEKEEPKTPTANKKPKDTPVEDTPSKIRRGRPPKNVAATSTRTADSKSPRKNEPKTPLSGKRGRPKTTAGFSTPRQRGSSQKKKSTPNKKTESPEGSPSKSLRRKSLQIARPERTPSKRRVSMAPRIEAVSEEEVKRSTKKTTTDTPGRRGRSAKIPVCYDDSSSSDQTPKKTTKKTPKKQLRPALKTSIQTPKVSRGRTRKSGSTPSKAPATPKRTRGKYVKVGEESTAIEEQEMPGREEQMANIQDFIESRIEDLTGGCMYISGLPGTGKTASVNQVLLNLSKRRESGELDYKLIKVSGMELTQPQQVFCRMAEVLLERSNMTASIALDSLTKYFNNKDKKRPPTILIIDELDMLCTRKQDVVYHLFDWPTKATSRLIVLTIANTMDLPERLLQGKVTSRMGLTRLTFRPYTYDQLEKIVQVKLGESGDFGSDARQLVARKVASLSGDARRALEICRRSLELANNSAVKMTHVLEALKEMLETPTVLAIKILGPLEKLFLNCIASEIQRTGVEETTLSEVQNSMKAQGLFHGVTDFTSSKVMEICARLASFRLILAAQDRAGLKQRISLNVNPDDLHFALKVADQI